MKKKLFYGVRVGIVSALLFLISSCGNEGTPPIAGPNVDRSTVFPEILSAEQREIFLPSVGGGKNPAAPPSTSGGIPQTLPLTPATTIKSLDGVYTPGQTVRVGVIIPENFQGVSPEIGPITGAVSAELQQNRSLSADSQGRIAFGVYVNASTTPGTYSFFVEMAGQYEITSVTILQAKFQ